MKKVSYGQLPDNKAKTVVKVTKYLWKKYNMVNRYWEFVNTP